MNIAEFVPYERINFTFGHQCWIKSSLWYIHVPMVCIISFNLFFYVFTALNIHRSKQETTVTREGDNATHSRIDMEQSRFDRFCGSGI